MQAADGSGRPLPFLRKQKAARAGGRGLVPGVRGHSALAVLTGMYSDTCEVYVAYKDYPRADEIVLELFSPDAVVEDGPDGPDGETEEEAEP